MGGMSTGRAGKRVTLTIPTQPTARTRLAGVRWIDLCDYYASLLRPVFCCLPNQLTLPDRQATARRLTTDPAFTRQWDTQCLEYQHRVSRCKGYELLGDSLGERARAVRALAAKP